MCAPPLHNHPPRRVIPGLAVKIMLKTDDSVAFIIVIILYYYSVRKIEVCYVHSPCH
ncbi:TPA: hypothetical protein MFM65_002206 [Klebsiella pneumoniae]|nr:hypothetical protein [Klebsiella pneumoniae]HBW8286474.1 hypothetical protein [Klebsiella pneumoniae]HBW8291821.1 hypothetical protein [Klebsiella pneumoniae]HBW8297352.1 hypothetical protein [Klebsiella pneumoniae]HBW8303070.1 hypothetical protein [Klebsiella pneumoniae]